MLKPEQKRDTLDMRNHNTGEQQERCKRSAVLLPLTPALEKRGISQSSQLPSIHISSPMALPPLSRPSPALPIGGNWRELRDAESEGCSARAETPGSGLGGFPACEVENRLRLSEQTCYLTVYKIF